MSATSISAQPGTEWDKKYEGEFADDLVTILPTSDGSQVLAGVSKSRISGEKTQDPVGGSSYVDFWTKKKMTNISCTSLKKRT